MVTYCHHLIYRIIAVRVTAQELVEPAQIRERHLDCDRSGWLALHQGAGPRVVASIAASDRVRAITASALIR